MFYCEKLCQSTVIGLAIIAFISYGNCAEHSTPRHYRNDDATPDPPTTPLPGVDVRILQLQPKINSIG